MRSLSGQSNFFGLDLGATAVRAVQLKGSGPLKELINYGYAPLDGTIGISDSEVDHTKLATVIGDMLKKAGITSHSVAVNVPSAKVFSVVIDMDRMASEELGQTIRYQADSIIPTPLAESKVDWALIGDSPKDPKKVEVLISSVPNKYIETRLAMLESMGLNVIAFEPDSLALARGLVAVDDSSPQLLLDLGAGSTDLVIAVGQTPHLSRSIAVGQQSLTQTVSQTLGIEIAQAHQFVFKFGLGKDKLDGQVYNALMPVIENLGAEIEKSIKFFVDRYPNQKLGKIVVTGGSAVLPEFPLYLANRFQVNVEIGNSWRNVLVPSARQNDTASVSNQFAIAAGLAEREA